MDTTNTSADQPEASVPVKRSRKRRKIIIGLVIVLIVLPLVSWGLLYANNNLLGWDDQDFEKRLDRAIAKATAWVVENQEGIKESKNFAIARMLQDINTMAPDPVYDEINAHFLSLSLGTFNCWKRMLDPRWTLSSLNLNKVIQKDYLDNKWILYAIAKDQAQLPDEVEKGLFDTQRWVHRVLTHQLWALIHLRQRTDGGEQLDQTIEAVCRRIVEREKIAICMHDIYIQRCGFVLFAGHPEKIKRRWIERIIANQRDDGGWNDRWLVFRSDSRRPTLDTGQASTQHATVQALWTLLQIKYRYPQHFGLQ